MSQVQTAEALAAVLLEHHDQLVDTLVGLAPAAGSGYQQASIEQLRPRMASIVDACIASLAHHDPSVLGLFMRAAAEERVREGYTVDSLITLAMFTEGALSDTAELAFETDAAQRAEARDLIRALIATAEQVLDKVVTESEPGS